jgi:hypothetical protein
MVADSQQQQQQQQADLLKERLASLGAFSSYYENLPPQIPVHYSPASRRTSSASSQSSSMMPPSSTPQGWLSPRNHKTMKEQDASSPTTVTTMASSFASLASIAPLTPPLMVSRSNSCTQKSVSSSVATEVPKEVSVNSSSSSSTTEEESARDHVQGKRHLWVWTFLISRSFSISHTLSFSLVCYSRRALVSFSTRNL